VDGVVETATALEANMASHDEERRSVRSYMQKARNTHSETDPSGRWLALLLGAAAMVVVLYLILAAVRPETGTNGSSQTAPESVAPKTTPPSANPPRYTPANPPSRR
jgi:hypothetical protein